LYYHNIKCTEYGGVRHGRRWRCLPGGRDSLRRRSCACATGAAERSAPGRGHSSCGAAQGIPGSPANFARAFV